MNKSDIWANAEAYEQYVGRWSRLVAREFVGWLTVPPGSHWLDVGCGTGALTEVILQHAQPAEVTGVDPSEGFVAYAREHVQDGRVSFKVGDAMVLPFGDEMFGAVVAGLVLNHIPTPGVALAEMVRVARRGGIVGAYVWDYAGQMQMMRVFWDAAVELDPAIVELDQGRRYPICQPEPLGELFKSAGLTGVEVQAIDVATHFRDFDDYWLPFLGGQGPAPSYATALTEEKKLALRERIRSKLPIAQDGSISLIARAWAVHGSKSQRSASTA
ncbi:MAG TPA: methyltransferase domain-containing protein [Chloroflexia bacterium]|nr:methyltransferase domain-containing protein [Chloroflexia bacterium]